MPYEGHFNATMHEYDVNELIIFIKLIIFSKLIKELFNIANNPTWITSSYNVRWNVFCHD